MFHLSQTCCISLLFIVFCRLWRGRSHPRLLSLLWCVPFPPAGSSPPPLPPLSEIEVLPLCPAQQIKNIKLKVFLFSFCTYYRVTHLKTRSSDLMLGHPHRTLKSPSLNNPQIYFIWDLLPPTRPPPSPPPLPLPLYLWVIILARSLI